MSHVNLVIVSGVVSRAPETRTTSGGKDVTGLTIDCKETWADRESHSFIKVSGWGEQSDNLSLMAEGDTIMVQGRWSSRSYDDRDGNKKWVTEVVARSVELLVAGTGPQVQAEPEDEGFDFR
jgi:single-strand DNA-binding protein